MAASDYFGANQTKALSPSSANVITRGQWGGVVRCQIDTYTTVAVSGGAKTIQMATIPAGATILEVVINIEAGAMASSGTLTLSKYDGTTETNLTAALDANGGVTNELITVQATRGKCTLESVVRFTASAHDIVVSKVIETQIYYTTD